MSAFAALVRLIGLTGLSLISLIAAISIIKRMRRRTPGPDSYKGKRILITGASSGIGRALAVQFAALGARVALVARRREVLMTALAECKDSIAIVADCSTEEGCNHAVGEVSRQFGGLDILVLNAGLGYKDRFSDVTLPRLRAVMDINYWGTVMPVMQALSLLRASRGQVIAVSSLSGITGGPKATGYAPSKHAVLGFMDSVRYDEPTIRFHTACPGYVVSEFHDKFMKENNGKRNLALFMTSEECARQIIESAFNDDRVLIMTLRARIGFLLRAFLPYRMIDIAVQKTALGAFDLQEDGKSQ